MRLECVYAAALAPTPYSEWHLPRSDEDGRSFLTQHVVPSSFAAPLLPLSLGRSFLIRRVAPTLSSGSFLPSPADRPFLIRRAGRSFRLSLFALSRSSLPKLHQAAPS